MKNNNNNISDYIIITIIFNITAGVPFTAPAIDFSSVANFYHFSIYYSKLLTLKYKNIRIKSYPESS